MNPETTTAVVAAIANRACHRYRKSRCFWDHPECAAAAATAWFTDWLREQRQFLPPQMCVDEGGMRTHEGPCDKPRPASAVIDALIEALGGDQATGGDDAHTDA